MSRQTAEELRLSAAHQHNNKDNWQRWGTYLSERQWGTVREDYSANGDCWNYLPHDHARSRAYRWGEDGLLGYTDRECRLCFAVALWNEKDPILKERLFGLSNPEGNHGEDVKEYYFYLDATPTFSYAKALYKYPQAEFPYARLVAEPRQRAVSARVRAAGDRHLQRRPLLRRASRICQGRPQRHSDPPDAGQSRPRTGPLHVLPTIWLRNTWAWGCEHDGCWPRGRMAAARQSQLGITHPSLGHFIFDAGAHPQHGQPAPLLFTENETNFERLFGFRIPRPMSRTPSTATSSRRRPRRSIPSISAPRPRSITCWKFPPAAS